MAQPRHTLNIIWDDDLKPGAMPDKVEKGRLMLRDPQGKIVGEYGFLCGGFGNGCAPVLEEYKIARDIKPFIVKGGKKQDGLRIDDASFDHCTSAKDRTRGGILIHHDAPPKGTLGCFGIQGEETWQKFADDWNAIDANERPRSMEHMSQAEYKQTKLAAAAEKFRQETQTGTTVPHKTATLKPVQR